ncbi:MAG: metallopeptidase family protein [Lachnospiraceae bacterium]|jgi:hypothetical protein
MTYERFSEITQEELKLLPAYVLEDLNGGVVVDEKTYLHPGRVEDDLYILGTYSTSSVMGRQIVLYYGSFMAVMGGADEDAFRAEIRHTLRHEFLHHMESRAGMNGKGSLAEQDAIKMQRYYMRHKKK